MKRLLMICRQAPFGSSLAREAIDVALAAAAFDQRPALLFLGDGVWQLCNGQHDAIIQRKAPGKAIASFSLYDIDEIYIDASAVKARQIEPSQMTIAGKLLSADNIRALLNDFDNILTF